MPSSIVNEYIYNVVDPTVTSVSGSTIDWTTGAVGTSGSYVIGANGTSALDWGNLTISSVNTNPSTISQSGLLELRGEKADIMINGQSLMTMMQQIQERLNILTVNTELESDWDELRELGRQYRELEQHIKDKMDTWQRLKAQDQDNR